MSSSSNDRRMVHEYIPDTNDNDDNVTTSTSTTTSYSNGGRNQHRPSYDNQRSKYQDHTDRTETDNDDDRRVQLPHPRFASSVE